MLNVVIPEPVPSLNKGELAILEGIRESLNAYGDVQLSVYSPPLFYKDDARSAEGQYHVVSGVDLYDLANNFLETPRPRSRFHFFRTWGKLYLFSLFCRLSPSLAAFIFFKDDFLKALSKADLIIAGHDGMLGAVQFHMVFAGRIMGKKVALFGGGNDAKGRKNIKVRKFLQYATKKSIICTVREPGIKEFLVANDVPDHLVHVFPDPAIMLKPCDDKRVDEILKKESIPHPSETNLYGLIPVRGGIVFEKSFSSEQEIEKKHQLRVDLWVAVVQHLLKVTDAHFIFIPHCIGPVALNDDRRMCRDIYNAFENKDRLTFIETEYSASDLKGIMNKCQYVLGERAHGLIGSVSSASPCLALTVEEDLRMHWLMERMFDRKTYNLNDPDIDELKNLLTAEWENRDATASQMAIKAVALKKEGQKAAAMLARSIKNHIRT